MTIIEAVILGIIQGLTEFLPVSSSGHLALFKNIFNIDIDAFGMVFDVSLHLATLLAVVIVMWDDIIILIKRPFRKVILYLVIATIPAAVVGMLFDKKIESVSNTLWLVGMFFIFTGVILAVSDALSKVRNTKKKSLRSMTVKSACYTGIAQAVAVFPGISRSGSTISAGLISGMDRNSATKFSFLMSIPIILGANIFKVKDIITGAEIITSEAIMPTAVGMITAGITGFIACVFMLNYIKKKGMKAFVYYMLGIGVLTVILGMFNRT